MQHGLSRHQVGYMRGVGNGDKNIDELMSNSQIRALGLVVDKVDKIMHGMTLGSSGMHNQVDLWLKEGFLFGLIDDLITQGYGESSTLV
jgi:hypothetical protein